MNQKIQRLVIVSGICLSLFACKSKEKSTEPATTDTSTTEKTAPAPDNTVKDAVTAAPNQYKVLKDTMGISVIEADYQPGDSTAMHSHHDYAVFSADGATATFYGQDGKSMESVMAPGTFLIRGGEVHSVKNTGKKAFKVIMVEVNRPNKPMTWDQSLDATKVAPNLYKLAKDTLGLRAIKVSYKPGQSSPMHAHPDVVLYVLDGSTAEFTEKDGSKRTAELTKGMVLIVPADTHSVKNTGKTTMKGIMVEVNRSVN